MDAEPVTIRDLQRATECLKESQKAVIRAEEDFRNTLFNFCSYRKIPNVATSGELNQQIETAELFIKANIEPPRRT